MVDHSIEAEKGEEASLLVSPSHTHNESEKPSRRTGTIWTAIAHIITGVIGAGVLSLAWSVAQLGWVAGPLTLVAFAGITVVSTFILCDCYRSPDPRYGPIRIPSLMEATKFYLGPRSQRVCAFFLFLGFYGTAVAYTISAASSVRAIQKSNCYRKEGQGAANCGENDYKFTLVFGLVQVVVSQIPNFHKMAWLSVVAAIMSFCYAFVGVGLGLTKVIENREILGSIRGVPGSNRANKIWSVFVAVGDIAFAYPYSGIVLEIEDTLKSPPPEVDTMRSASIISIITTTLFYLCCSCFGYAAFGNNTPGNLLTGFPYDYKTRSHSYNYWLLDFANACIVLHLIGGYQIYSQPIFSLADQEFAASNTNKFKFKFKVDLPLNLIPSMDMEFNLFRLGFRTAYVLTTTLLALLFPYFNQVLGILGALNFWPLAIYFPMQMYLEQREISAWTRKWLLLQLFSITCLIISLVGMTGSVQKLIAVTFTGYSSSELLP